MHQREPRVLVGLSGGIACYKIPSLVRLLRADNIAIQVVMTPNATRFITPLTLEAVANTPVAVELFPETGFVATRHIDLAHWPDLIVIAPATANLMGRVVAGISDDLLTTVLCATDRPVMFAPAMNPFMWENKVTQRNYAYLRDELGWISIPPGEGKMACDDVGVGRMAEPEEIYARIVSQLGSASSPRSLAGKTVLVTAGATRERIDPVRFVSNYSSGKMGIAIAAAARNAGARTILVAGSVSAAIPSGIEVVTVESTDQMYDAVRTRFQSVDYLFMAAAPADFVPTPYEESKIKKNGTVRQLTLAPAVDILASLKPLKRAGQRVIGFALETDNGIEHATRKLTEKGVDLMILNSPSQSTGFATDTNQVTLIAPGKPPEAWPLMEKSEIARKIIAGILPRLS